MDLPEDVINKAEFEENLKKYYTSKNRLWTNAIIANVIELLKKYKDVNSSKPALYYYYCRKYEVSQWKGRECIIFKRKNKGDQQICIVPFEDYYSLLLSVHASTRHGKRVRMAKDIEKQFHIPRIAIDVFVKTCKVCAGAVKRDPLPRPKRTSIKDKETPKIKTEKCVSKVEFEKKLSEYYDDKALLWPREDLESFKDLLRHSTPEELEIDPLLSNLEIRKQNGVFTMHKKDTAELILPTEDLYKTLSNVHNETNHGELSTMSEVISGKFCIPDGVIELFLECATCNKSSVEVMDEGGPTLEQRNFLYHMDLSFIELDEVHSVEYKYLMVLRETDTKYLHVRPLRVKDPQSIALKLMKIFLQFGAPRIIRIEKDKNFLHLINQELCILWEECSVIAADLILRTELGELHRLHQRIQEKLNTWVEENPNKLISLGCYCVQWALNN